MFRMPGVCVCVHAHTCACIEMEPSMLGKHCMYDTGCHFRVFHHAFGDVRLPRSQ